MLNVIRVKKKLQNHKKKTHRRTTTKTKNTKKPPNKTNWTWKKKIKSNSVMHPLSQTRLSFLLVPPLTICCYKSAYLGSELSGNITKDFHGFH